ncbi:MAG: hypothetical protein P8X96_22675 [Desulfobacteraceae bacterium]
MDPEALHRRGLLNSIDRAFAEMIHRIQGENAPWVALAAGLVSRAAADGNVCLDLESIVDDGIPVPDGNGSLFLDISLERWRRLLNASTAVGNTNEKNPLI